MSVSSRKKDDSRISGNGARVKLRWMELDVEGGTTDLVEGFKSFAAELRGVGGRSSPRALAEAKPNGAASATAVIDDSPAEQENLLDATDIEAVDKRPSEAITDPGVDNRKRRPAPRAPKFLSDLDLTKASVQLNDFVQEKSPVGDMDRYAVIAVWFKQYFNMEEISIDEIFTAYKVLGWQAQLPDDPSQTFRNLKNNKNWFDSGSKRGSYKINWNGESAVTKMGAAKP
jgi:hypothetical protein